MQSILQLMGEKEMYEYWSQTPDLAEGPPEIASSGKEITVKLKHGIRFSPPVNREVTSEDVKYAFERGANPQDCRFVHRRAGDLQADRQAAGGQAAGQG